MTPTMNDIETADLCRQLTANPALPTMAARTPVSGRRPNNCVNSGVRRGGPPCRPGNPRALNLEPFPHPLRPARLQPGAGLHCGPADGRGGQQRQGGAYPRWSHHCRLRIDLGFGAAVNPGVLTASLVIFFSMTAALLCVAHNRLTDRTFGRTLTSVVSWLATIAAFVFFVLTLALVPIALAVEVGL